MKRDIIILMENTCSHVGCNSRHYARGYCEKHYQRQKKRGQPDDGPGHHASFETRFWLRVEKADGCWRWAGPLYKGYGRLWHNGATIRAHRASWIVHFGEIPDGVLVCHHCDNPSCVNPAHLYLGTHRENMDDKIRRNRCARLDRKGEKAGRARLTSESVLAIRADRRKHNQIAAAYRVHPTTICDIKRRKSWKHI